MRKNYHTFRTRMGLSASLMMLFTLGMKAQCPSVNSITATPANICAGGNSQLNVSIGNVYNVTNIPYAPIATPGTGVTVLCDAGSEITPTEGDSGLDDGGWIDQPIPFNFNFFGIDYTSFSVGTNGFVYLGSGAPVRGSGGSTYQGYYNSFPSTDAVAPSIGVIYADLDFRTTGTISYFTTGITPNRILVVNYTGGQFYNTAGSLTTQVLIYETSNIIEVHTTNSTGDKTAVEGIQNAAGDFAFTVPGRNSETWVVDSIPDGYRFAPVANTYTWAPATFLSSTTTSNPMATGVTGTTTYTVTVVSGGSCTTTASISINVSPLGSTSNISPSNSVCEGTDVTLSSDANGGGEPYSFEWSGPDGFTSTSQNPTIEGSTVSATGTYTVTITDDCGSTSINTVALTVNPPPSVMVSPTAESICSNGTSSVALTASGSATSYDWSPSDGLDATSGSDVSAFPLTTTTYTVVGTDDNGCISSATTMITVNNPPVLVTTATPSAVCSGGSSELMVAASLPTTSYDVTSITYAPIPTPGAGIITVLCDADSIIVPLTSPSWSSLDDGDWADQPLPFTFNFFGTDYTSFSVSTNGFITLGAGEPATYTGYGDALPYPFAGRPSIGPMYADLDFRDQGTINYFTTGIAPNRVLVINYNDGQFYSGSGSFTAQLLLFETSNVIEVHTASSTGDNPAVEGIQNSDGSVAFVVPGRNSDYWTVSTPDAYRFAPPVATYTYAWAGTLAGETVDNPTASDITSTSTFDLVTTASNGCSSDGSVSVIVNPVISFVAPVTPICLQAAPIVLTATPSGGVFTGPGVDSIAGTFDPSSAGVGTAIPVVYTVTDTNSCTGSLAQNFDVQDCTGITENTFSQDVNMYPNPTSGMFTIEIPGANFSTLKISIVDPQGKEVYSFSDSNIRSEYKKQVNLDNLAKGIYFIKLSTDNGVKVKKLTLQ